MTIALWTIALIEAVRLAEQTLQLRMISKDTGARDNAYAEFIKSLKTDDREFVRNMLDEFEQTDIPKSTLRTDCTGCRFVGTYDTVFPCVNCVRKNKDYYDAEQTEERSE